MSATEVHENEMLSTWVSGGIAYVVYKVNRLDIETAQKCIDFRLSHADGQFYPMLIDARQIKEVNRQAREYLAGEKASRYVTACAFIIDSVVGKLTGNFFLNISRPKIPTRLFTNYAEAETWLANFKPVKSTPSSSTN